MRIRIPKELWIASISVIIGSIATFYIPKILTSDEVAIEFAPIYKEQFINIPELLNGRVKILVDEIPQKNLSVMDVLLFNRSYKDLKNIPITFEFYEEDEKELPVLLGKQLSKPDTFPKDSIKEVPQESDQYVRYQISSMPVAEKYTTDFVASFVFLGDKAPKVQVQSDYAENKVISIYEYDKDKRNRDDIIVALIIIIPLIVLFIICMLWLNRKDRELLLDRISKEAEKLDYEGIDKSLLKEVALQSYKAATGRKTNKEIKRN